jgi:PAS domain S-box-containing protein
MRALELRGLKRIISNARLFHLLMENVKEYALFVIDKEGRILEWNVGAEHVLGYKTEEIVGQPLSRIFTPEDIESGAPQQELQTALKQGKAEDERWHVRKNGSRFWASGILSTICDRDGNVVGFTKILRDFTERKLAEEELRGKEQQLRWRTRLLDMATDAIFIVDLDDRIVYWNKGAERLYGWTREEAEGRQARQLLRTVFSGSYEQAKESLLRENAWQGELAHTKRNGEKVMVRSHWTLERDAHGRPVSFLAINYDVTEQRRWEERTKTLNAELEKRIEERTSELRRIHDELDRIRDEALRLAQVKTEFLTNMSHEMRTPLIGIIGMVEILKQNPLTHEQRHCVEIVENSSRVLLQTINLVLESAGALGGKIRFHVQEMDVRKIVEDLRHSFLSAAQEKGLSLTVSVASGVSETLYGDEAKLRQALINLLANAVKFTEKGDISVRVQEEKQDPSESILRVEISDTGIGIAPEDRQKIFEPFTQADPSASRRFGGMGLGLTLSKKLVEQMKGEIGVHSDPGKGSTFWIRIPLKNRVVPRETAPAL